MTHHRPTALAALVFAALICGQALADPPAAAPADPSLAGFPPGYIQSCADRPKTAVVAVPAPQSTFMRIVCTRVSDALAPLPGFRWAFTNGTTGFLTALNPNVAPGDQPANFTRLTNAPLTAAETAAFRKRLGTVTKTPAMLTADILRLEVDTSTADHKQEYLLVAHDAKGAVSGAWGIECYNDCTPMEANPWAFTVLPGS